MLGYNYIQAIKSFKSTFVVHSFIVQSLQLLYCVFFSKKIEVFKKNLVI